MNIMEKNITYKTMIIIADILIAFSIIYEVLFIVGVVKIYKFTGNFDTIMDSFSGPVVNISRIILIPILWGAFLVILFHLRKIFISIAGDKPFEMRNIVRVKSIGYALFILGVFKLTGFLIFVFFHDTSHKIGMNTSKHIMNFVQFLFAGFVILVVAKVFRLGAEMYNEHKLTV